MKELSAERLSLLKKFGFSDNPDSNISWGFPARAYVTDTKICVQGNHATDHAYVYYSSLKTDEDEDLSGLFYASSL